MAFGSEYDWTQSEGASFEILSDGRLRRLGTDRYYMVHGASRRHIVVHIDDNRRSGDMALFHITGRALGHDRKLSVLHCTHIATIYVTGAAWRDADHLRMRLS
jgi:hypothetical protein